MSLEPANLLLLAILSAAIHWLMARSDVMRPFWSRAHGRAARLLECAACSGFWLGLGLWAVGLRPLAGLPELLDALATGLLGLYVTPVAEGVLVWGLEKSVIDGPAV